MKKIDDEDDIISELERIDRFYDGDEEGDVPLEILAARGLEMPDDAALDDEALHAKLWDVIRGMASLYMYIDSTDHLSDRELYRYLREALKEPTVLSGNPSGAWNLSPIGGCSNEDNIIYLRYYADEDERKSFREDFEGEFPAHEEPPYDRDRLLPTFEQTVAMHRPAH